MLWLSIRIASAKIPTTYDFMEKLPLFIVLILTPDFPRFYYTLGATFVRRGFRDGRQIRKKQIAAKTRTPRRSISHLHLVK